MMLDPVDQESCSVTKPNSCVAQRMTSSASRLTSTPIWAETKANSATKSRDAVPSIEFAVEPVKPSSAATPVGSRPRLWPARAPEPYGESAATRASQSASRSTSRSSGHACAIRWWDSSTGCACCRCVRPGMIVGGAASEPRCCSAWSASAWTRSSTWAATTRAWSRRNTLNSVAIWSLRERPARSRPPTSGPTSSSSSRSRAPWTSSSEGSGRSSPAAYRSPSTCRPRSSSAWSASASSPARCSALAWAREPARS